MFKLLFNKLILHEKVNNRIHADPKHDLVLADVSLNAYCIRVRSKLAGRAA